MASTTRHLVAASIALVACALMTLPLDIHGQAYAPDNMSDAMDASLYLGEFKAALEVGGLLEQLSSPDFNGTIFAPVDAGFLTWLQANNTSVEKLAADNATFMRLLGIHIVPGLKYFPMSTLRQGAKLPTMSGDTLLVDRNVPGLVHIWGSPTDSMTGNFGTILQYQEIKDGKAVLYTIDKPINPPAPQAPPPAPLGRPSRVTAQNGRP